MSGSLFWKECRQILHSLVYYIFLLIMILFMTSQLSENEMVSEPEPGEEYYGMKESTDTNVIMANTLADLVQEIDRNSFATSPTGFYKEVNVSDSEVEELKNIVEKCTEKEWDTLQKEATQHFAQYELDNMEGAMAADLSYLVYPAESLTYSAFSDYMEQVCDIVGRGSDYEKSKYESNAEVPMTYEEAVESYEALCKEDGITDAFMRLFCDYAGILLSLLPIFLGVTRCVRDKRAKVEQVIYTKSAKSYTIILSRYLANVVMLVVPVLLLAGVMQTSYVYQAMTLGVKPHYLAFLFYTGIWLLPSILIVLSVAFLITEAFHGIAAIIFQVFWAVASLQATVGLKGNFGWNLIPRWNTFGETISFASQKTVLYQNRLVYAIAAVIVLGITILLYSYKRRGGWHFHGKNK